jgi:hypothetical protein
LSLPQLRSFAAPAIAGIRASAAASFCEAAANQIWFHTNSEHRLSAGSFLTFESPFRLFFFPRRQAFNSALGRVMEMTVVWSRGSGPK